MISAFLKKTFDSKQVNLVKPLQIYIRDAYGKDKEKEKMPIIEEIQQYRDACNVTEDRVSPPTAIQKYETYLAYVTFLAKRFSFGKSGRGVFSKASKIEVAFKWVDSYRHTKIEQNMDIKLEKFAVLFNLGALMSLHAVRLSEQDEDGLKAACKLFRESGGVFEYMAQHAGNDLVPFVQNLDIQKDSCKFLSTLMLAQAQACFAEMAMKKKMKPALIAALAMGTSDFFQKSVSFIDMTPAFKSWVDKGQYNFREHCLHQQQYYIAVAHYHESIRVSKLSEDGVYGKEIAWLQSANSILATLSTNNKTKLVPTLATHRKMLAKKVSSRLKDALKDNNDIYHESVPNIKTLRAIAGRQNVAISEFTPKLDVVVDPFKNMVAKETQKKADQVKADVMAEVSALKLKSNESTDNARAVLASLGLPAAVDAASSPTGLPDAVWQRITECKKVGGGSQLRTLYSRIETIDKECWEILQSEVIATLDAEQAIDTQIRTKLGSAQWTRNASPALQSEYRQQCQTIANHLATAAATNTNIDKSLSEHDSTFTQLFECDREMLATQLPQIDDEAKDNAEAEQLKVLLDELSALIGRRDELLDELEKEATSVDVAQLFLQHENGSVEAIKSMAQQPLQEMRKQIEDGIEAQTANLEKISTQNERFVAAKENDSKQNEREQRIHAWNEACGKFKECERHLTEGTKFYADLLADYLLPLKDEVDNFCAARESERDLLLADLGQNVQKLGIDTSVKMSASASTSTTEEKTAVQPPQSNEYVQPPPPQQAPAQGFNPWYSQQQQQQLQSQPQPSPAQTQVAAQPVQPQPQQIYYAAQPPPAQPYYQQQQQQQQPPPHGYYYPPPGPQPYYGQPQPVYYQQAPPSGQQQPPQHGAYNPAYHAPPGQNNNPSAPTQ